MGDEDKCPHRPSGPPLLFCVRITAGRGAACRWYQKFSEAVMVISNVNLRLESFGPSDEMRLNYL